MLAHNDYAGLFVDDHPGNLVGLNAKLFNIRQQRHDATRIVLGDDEPNGAGIGRLRMGLAKKPVDFVRYATRGRKIGVAKR